MLISTAMTGERNQRPASDARSLLRELPSVDRLLGHPALAAAIEAHGRGAILHHVRLVVEELRARLLGGSATPDAVEHTTDALAGSVIQSLAREGEPLPRILNATGVILHSGLGRAPLPQSAVQALVRAGGYSLLEVDRERGERRARDSRAADLICRLTGAESALVVNNNAAATLLILNTLASGREVVCSRGELVEIGGSFRIPDVMEASGCRLVAVGTTNRTHLADFEAAITERTAALLVVHTSNYRIVGFTAVPALDEVAALARSRGLPCVHDLGSGSLLSPAELGVGDEPPAARSIQLGADVACMSGDKLLGGPQAGIIIGRRDLVERMRKSPLARAMRVDKMAIAALEATLRLFLDPDRLRERHPVIRMLTLSREDLRLRARALADGILAEAPAGTQAEIVEVDSEAGSGALPTLHIPSLAVAVSGPMRPDALAGAERKP